MEPADLRSVSPRGGATATAQVGGWDWENAGHKAMTRVFLASPTVILVAVMFPASQWLALVWLALLIVGGLKAFSGTLRYEVRPDEIVRIRSGGWRLRPAVETMLYDAITRVVWRPPVIERSVDDGVAEEVEVGGGLRVSSLNQRFFVDMPSDAYSSGELPSVLGQRIVEHRREQSVLDDATRDYLGMAATGAPDSSTRTLTDPSPPPPMHEPLIAPSDESRRPLPGRLPLSDEEASRITNVADPTTRAVPLRVLLEGVYTGLVIYCIPGLIVTLLLDPSRWWAWVGPLLACVVLGIVAAGRRPAVWFDLTDDVVTQRRRNVSISLPLHELNTLEFHAASEPGDVVIMISASTVVTIPYRKGTRRLLESIGRRITLLGLLGTVKAKEGQIGLLHRKVDLLHDILRISSYPNTRAD